MVSQIHSFDSSCILNILLAGAFPFHNRSREELDLVQRRRRLLQSFLNRLLQHPVLSGEHLFHRFLEEKHWASVLPAFRHRTPYPLIQNIGSSLKSSLPNGLTSAIAKGVSGMGEATAAISHGFHYNHPAAHVGGMTRSPSVYSNSDRVSSPNWTDTEFEAVESHPSGLARMTSTDGFEDVPAFPPSRDPSLQPVKRDGPDVDALESALSEIRARNKLFGVQVSQMEHIGKTLVERLADVSQGMTKMSNLLSALEQQEADRSSANMVARVATCLDATSMGLNTLVSHPVLALYRNQFADCAQRFLGQSPV